MNDVPPRAVPSEHQGSLYFHGVAAHGISRFRTTGVVGEHPAYLVGMEVPPHRGGPALAALLVLHDGRLLAATSRPHGKRPDLNDLFPYDIDAADGEELRGYTQVWNEKLGGFGAVVYGAVSDYDAARSMLRTWGSAAAHLSDAIAFDLEMNQELSQPWDASATAVMVRPGVVCAVYGFSPDPADVEALDVSDELKRCLSISPTPGDNFLLAMTPELRATAGSRFVGVIEEAIDNRLRSPRACVALLRTAAEIIVHQIAVEYGIELDSRSPLAKKIGTIESAWHQPGEKPSTHDRGEIAWRARMVLALDTSRDLGNMIHFEHDATIDDADRALHVTRDLLLTWLRQGVLDK